MAPTESEIKNLLKEAVIEITSLKSEPNATEDSYITRWWTTWRIIREQL